VVSFIFGILVVFNRFDSFRETCKVIKLRDQSPGSDSLENLRDENDETDLRTWIFFHIQWVSFVCAGAFFFVHANRSELGTSANDLE
jgi:hypothetical protein